MALCLCVSHLHTCKLAAFCVVYALPPMQDGDTTVFMGVPTMYALLLAVYDKMSPAKQAAAAAAASRLRLTVSGSSACPVPIMERWGMGGCQVNKAA